MQEQQAATAVAGKIGKLLQQHFCQGPRTTKVIFSPPYIMIHLGGFLAPMEQTLIADRKKETVRKYRNLIFNKLEPALQDIVQAQTGIVSPEMYADWDLQQASGMLLFASSSSHFSNIDSPASFLPARAGAEPDTQSGFHPNSGRWEKSLWFDDNTLFCQRNNVITPLEQELLQTKGRRFVEEHRIQADKGALDTARLAQVFHHPLQDVFVTGSLTARHSHTVLCFNE